MSKLVTILSEVCKVESFGLTQEQHDLAVRMIDQNENGGDYSLDEFDPDLLDYFIEYAIEFNDKKYEEFLTNAKLNDADLYTFTEHFDDFSQVLGDVAVYNKTISKYSVYVNSECVWEGDDYDVALQKYADCINKEPDGVVDLYEIDNYGNMIFHELIK